MENENYGSAVDCPKDCPPPYPSHPERSQPGAYPKLQQPSYPMQQMAQTMTPAKQQCNQQPNNPQSNGHLCTFVPTVHLFSPHYYAHLLSELVNFKAVSNYYGL